MILSVPMRQEYRYTSTAVHQYTDKVSGGKVQMVTSHYENLGLRYISVANALRQKIVNGLYQPGERLQPQHNLAKEHNVSFITLKRALDVLEQEGYVVRKIGQGTYASLPEDNAPTALIIDDDSIIRELFSRALPEFGWNTVVADSGEAGVEAFGAQQFDLIFLDLVMPGMNGAETFREIRKLAPNAYVVIITGYPDSTIMAEALDIGPFAVMKKPFSLEELGVVLGRVAGGHELVMRRVS